MLESYEFIPGDDVIVILPDGQRYKLNAVAGLGDGAALLQLKERK